VQYKGNNNSKENESEMPSKNRSIYILTNEKENKAIDLFFLHIRINSFTRLSDITRTRRHEKKEITLRQTVLDYV